MSHTALFPFNQISPRVLRLSQSNRHFLIYPYPKPALYHLNHQINNTTKHHLTIIHLSLLFLTHTLQQHKHKHRGSIWFMFLSEQKQNQNLKKWPWIAASMVSSTSSTARSSSSFSSFLFYLFHLLLLLQRFR